MQILNAAHAVAIQERLDLRHADGPPEASRKIAGVVVQTFTLLRIGKNAVEQMEKQLDHILLHTGQLRAGAAQTQQIPPDVLIRRRHILRIDALYDGVLERIRSGRVSANLQKRRVAHGKHVVQPKQEMIAACALGQQRRIRDLCQRFDGASDSN